MCIPGAEIIPFFGFIKFDGETDEQFKSRIKCNLNNQYGKLGNHLTVILDKPKLDLTISLIQLKQYQNCKLQEESYTVWFKAVRGLL